VFAGKIAREARSAGVTLALGTQKLSAKMLDTIPGAGDLKVNLSRVLLGKTSRGERMSALRDPDDTPDLNGIVPRGPRPVGNHRAPGAGHPMLVRHATRLPSGAGGIGGRTTWRRSDERATFFQVHTAGAPPSQTPWLLSSISY